MFWENDKYTTYDIFNAHGYYRYKSDADKIYCNFNRVNPLTGEYICKDENNLDVYDYSEMREDEFVGVDKSIFNTVCILNKKGYKTFCSCGGHFSTYDSLSLNRCRPGYFPGLLDMETYIGCSGVYFTIKFDPAIDTDIAMASVMVSNIIDCSKDLPTITDIELDKLRGYIIVKGLDRFGIYRNMPGTEYLYNKYCMYTNMISYENIRNEIIEVGTKMRNYFDSYIASARKEFEILATRLPDLNQYRR